LTPCVINVYKWRLPLIFYPINKCGDYKITIN
jgi:hypothetical protein